MNGNQIVDCLRGKLGPKVPFVGVYTADQIQNINVIHKTYTFVVNTLDSRDTREMGHWITCFMSAEQIVFFDSYGLNPNIYSNYFKQFTEKHINMPIRYFSVRLQSDTSTVCGLYCCMLIHYMSQNGIHRICEFIHRHFTGNYTNNDKIVILYAKRRLNCIKSLGLE